MTRECREWFTAGSYYFLFRKEMSSKYLLDFSAVQLRASLVWDVARRRLVAGSSGQHGSLILSGQATREEIAKLNCLALDNETRCSAVAVTNYQLTAA
jgi:hypothetical protein